MKKQTISSLKKKLDKIFSEYIRKRDKARCFTCGKQGEVKTMQCGHYVPRQHLVTRYSEINCNTQCVGCNVFKRGNMDEYALKLKKKYGPRVLEELNREKYKIHKWTIEDYLGKIYLYETKLKEYDH